MAVSWFNINVSLQGAALQAGATLQAGDVRHKRAREQSTNAKTVAHGGRNADPFTLAATAYRAALIAEARPIRDGLEHGVIVIHHAHIVFNVVVAQRETKAIALRSDDPRVVPLDAILPNEDKFRGLELIDDISAHKRILSAVAAR